MPFIIKVSEDFSIGTVFSTMEKAVEVADKLPLQTYEIEEIPSALKSMVEKLDKRNPRTSQGYVTKRNELIAILQEVTPLISVAILEQELPYSQQGKDISVTIKLGLTLERDLL